jgi:hypothetical protein
MTAMQALHSPGAPRTLHLLPRQAMRAIRRTQVPGTARILLAMSQIRASAIRQSQQLNSSR